MEQEDKEILPDLTPRPRQPAGCYRTGGITCGVVVLALVVLMLFLYALALRNPGMRGLFGRAQVFASCQEQMMMIGQALKRYEIRYGQYPDSLAALYPKFLTSRQLLKCPADNRSLKEAIADSYVYVKPAPGAPAETPVVLCNRHILIPGSPAVTLVLRKNGKVAPSPASTAPPISRPRESEKKRSGSQ